MGFKIGLEIMVRCDCSRVVDVPITFREREAGESKLTTKQNVEYVCQLARLYLHAYPATVVGVSAVGFCVFWTILAVLGLLDDI